MTDKFVPGHALLIGVGADLPSTVRDAVALRDVLTDPRRGAYLPEHVESLTEASANRQGILDAFNRLIERVKHAPNATVFVYYSGHGGQIRHAGKLPEYFLVPSGYDPSHRTETALSGAEFTSKIEAINAQKLVVLLDCCHAGGIPALKESGETFVKSPLPPDLLQILEAGSGRVVIASSYENEYSYSGTQYGIFTACLLEALEGKAAVKKDGFARILDILMYLFEQVPRRAPGPQHPLVKKVLDLGDNFPLCYYAGGSKGIPGEEPPPVLSLASHDLTAGRRHRLEQRCNILREEWNLRSEKIKRIRVALAAESSVTITFQLEQQLLGEEARLAHLGNELEEIEQQL